MIHKTAVIYDGVIIEENVHIGAFCIIGARAESKEHWDRPQEFSVIIRKGAIITGGVTIDSGTERHTEIKQGAFIMKGAHVGHDAIIKEDVTLSPHVIVGGHSVIGRRSNLGMGAIIHQRCEVPSGCMIGMNSTVTKSSKMDKDRVYIGSPIKFLRWNKRK